MVILVRNAKKVGGWRMAESVVVVVVVTVKVRKNKRAL